VTEVWVGSGRRMLSWIWSVVNHGIARVQILRRQSLSSNHENLASIAAVEHE